MVLSFTQVKAQLEDTLTNQKIVKLFKAGFSKEILKSKIQSSPSKFDVTTDGLINLKRSGVPDDVINMMIAKPQQYGNSEETVYSNNPAQGKLNLESGIYYKTPKGEYQEIDPSVLSSTKSNNAAQFFISGLINAKLKVSISEKESSFIINEPTPTIVFVFDTSQRNNLNNDNNQYFSTARSPKEFLLVKLNATANSRELIVGKSNMISENMGIDDKSVMHFTTKKLYNGTYEIVPSSPLAVGEYCIMFSQGIKKGQSTKVFDFSIRQAKSF